MKTYVMQVIYWKKDRKHPV